jgi:hypothetical protein
MLGKRHTGVLGGAPSSKAVPLRSHRQGLILIQTVGGEYGLRSPFALPHERGARAYIRIG